MKSPIFILEDSSRPHKENNVPTKSVHTFDEAVTECGVGKFHYFTFVACGFCFVEIVLAIYSTQLYIMFTKCDLQITIHEEGIVTSATLMGIIASSHAWGFISDKWGRIKVIRISIPGTVIFIILSALASTTPMLITCRFLVGVLIGGCQASVFSYFGEFFNSEVRPRSVARTSMFFAFGSLLAPVLAITFLPFKFDWTIYGYPFSSWRLVEMTCALPGICVLVVLPYMPESPKFLLSKGDNEGSLKVLRYIYFINTGKSREEYPVEKLYEDDDNLKESDVPSNPLSLLWNQTIQMFLKSRLWVSLNLLSNFFFSYAVWNGLHAWYPEILTLTSKLRETGMTVCEIIQNELKTTPNMTGPSHSHLGCATEIDNTIYHVVIVIGLVNAVVYMISGYVVKLFRKKHLIAFWLLFSGLSTVLITWCRNFYLTNFLFLNVNMIAVNAGLVIAIAFDWTIYGHPFSSWRLVEMTCALPGICVLVVLPFMPESPKFLLSKGDNEGSLKVLRYIYYINTGKSKDEYPVEKLYEDSANLKESDEPRNPFLLLWNQTIQMFLKSRVWVSLNLLTNIFVSYAVWNGLHAWYPEILTLTSKLRETGMTVCEIVQNELKTTPNMTGPPHGDLGCATKIDNTIYHVVIVIGLVNAVVYMISGYVVKLFRKKHLIAFWLLFSGLSTVLITWCRHFYLTNFLFLNVNMIAVNVGLIVAIAVSYFPTSISATTVCLTMMSGRIGQVVGVNVIGFILPRNCELIFYGSGTVLCCFALLSLLLPSDQSERNGSVDHSIPKSSTSGSNSDINPVNTVKV
ncbi:unnamed protein product [Hermetia illucens]|uniref:Major facilitator superfamily (MFS) profile domain-containing protein n=1 Tax=Hermetia illucens TaxID=343691 RepID=A0A7R8UZZ3_HERIL|nr:unnamed protein product [Hermetia illucens]